MPKKLEAIIVEKIQESPARVFNFFEAILEKVEIGSLIEYYLENCVSNFDLDTKLDEILTTVSDYEYINWGESLEEALDNSYNSGHSDALDEIENSSDQPDRGNYDYHRGYKDGYKEGLSEGKNQPDLLEDI